MDPVSALTLIGSGLALVDQFYELVKKFRGEPVYKHSVTVQKEGKKLIINDRGHEQEIGAEELRLSELDQLRHDTLKKRIDVNWKKFNALDSARALAAADEKVRLELQMEAITAELCPDLKKLVKIYEEVLNRSLPDHYTLFDVCAPDLA